MAKIAVLGANYQYLTFYKQAVEVGGHEIIAFGRQEDDHIAADRYASKFYPISFTEKEKILEICKKEKVEGVTSFLIESALPYVYYVMRGLGLPCNSRECEELTANKYTMREQLSKEGVSIPLYEVISSPRGRINIPLPIIIKPADSGGSRGITLVRDMKDVYAAIDRALAYSPSKTAMVEQYIDGREFSIEAISYEGRHFILQVTDKVTTGSPNFVELEHHQPADLTLSQRSSIEQITLDMLDALKIGYGASHTEIRFDANDNPYIIEMGPRMGGDFISSDLVRLSTGYDFVNGTIEACTGHFTTPIIRNLAHSGIYLLCEETKDRVLPYIQHPELYPEVVDADIWGAIQPVKCNSDRGGYFIYQSSHKLLV